MQSVIPNRKRYLLDVHSKFALRTRSAAYFYDPFHTQIQNIGCCIPSKNTPIRANTAVSALQVCKQITRKESTHTISRSPMFACKPPLGHMLLTLLCHFDDCSSSFISHQASPFPVNHLPSLTSHGNKTNKQTNIHHLTANASKHTTSIGIK